MRRLVLTVLLLAAAAAGTRAAAPTAADLSPGPAGRAPRAAPRGPLLAPGLVRGDGRTVPPLASADPITGRPVSLASRRGMPVVLNVWGSWCGPCTQEAPVLGRFAARHPGLVLGVDTRDPPPLARAFARRYRLHYANLFDPQGVMYAALRASGTPTTLFLDRRLRVVAEHLGPVTDAQLEAGLRLALASR